ncbi:hypothetical protein X975_20122, partial [Stegodyphus mimosarum]
MIYGLAGHVFRETITNVHNRHSSINKIRIHAKTIPDAIQSSTDDNIDTQPDGQPSVKWLKEPQWLPKCASLPHANSNRWFSRRVMPLLIMLSLNSEMSLSAIIGTVHILASSTVTNSSDDTVQQSNNNTETFSNISLSFGPVSISSFSISFGTKESDTFENPA